MPAKHEIVLERQREGIAKAKAEGRYKGRPPSLNRARCGIAEKPGIARSSAYWILEGNS